MPFDPLTIVFAIVAIVVVWKLNGVLGQSTGFQRQRPPAPPTRDNKNQTNAPAATPGDNVVRLPGSAPTPDAARWTPHLERGSDAAVPGLDAIAAADPAFSAAPFLDGARTAYEAILTAFATGERRTLQNLLAPEVFDGFNAALQQRERAKEKMTTTLVSIDDAKIRSATLDGSVARLVVRFLSKQISATQTASGAVVSGSTDEIAPVDDIWTFARTISSRDPNWKLVATETGH